MNPASMTEPPIATERRKPKWLLWLSLGCLMFILAVGSCIAIGVNAWRNTDSELTQVAEADIRDIATSWDASVLRSRFDERTRANQSEEEATKLLAWFSDALGPVVEVRSSRLQAVVSSTAGRTGTVVSEVEFDKAIGLCTIAYSDRDGEWMITAFEVRSPALAPTTEQSPASPD
ncbi:MAG: hypothetical protein WD716_08660 [Fimbriimonadaceae bacterium]